MANTEAFASQVGSFTEPPNTSFCRHSSQSAHLVGHVLVFEVQAKWAKKGPEALYCKI